MRVVVVPCLSDNYAYLLIDDETKLAAAVDPAEAHLVVAKARSEGVRIVAVLTTHCHSDHAGGNSEMRRQVPDIEIYGGRLDRVQACTHPLDHGDRFSVGGITVQALHTPGHTRGSFCYHCTLQDRKPTGTEPPEDEPQEIAAGVVFTGDTLFVAGCGRTFDGTPEEMHNSIMNVLGRLHEDTQVYVGHEYTIKNLQFAVTVDTENENLKDMLQFCKQLRLERKFTVPSTLKNEMLINPFMRSGCDELQAVCPGCTPVEVFAKLRKMKNRF